ncbi:MAG: hypothetical protein WC623_21975 [Pedobacter sp.]
METEKPTFLSARSEMGTGQTTSAIPAPEQSQDSKKHGHTI